MSADGYAGLAQWLCEIAERHCQGRVVAVTEGGYDLTALRACLEAAIAVLDGARVPPCAETLAPRQPRSRTAMPLVRAAHAKSWRI